MGAYRRRIEIVTEPGEARAVLEDDYHNFRVAIRHDGATVTDIASSSPRVPTTLCVHAGKELQALVGMRLIMVIGVVGAPVWNAILTRLLSIVETVRAGDPFVTENASRLQTIAWSVLALELGRFVVVGIANSVSTAARPIHIDLNLSVTPWLAVLLLFVLARVFDHGARMREDLAGTV